MHVTVSSPTNVAGVSVPSTAHSTVAPPIDRTSARFAPPFSVNKSPPPVTPIEGNIHSTSGTSYPTESAV